MWISYEWNVDTQIDLSFVVLCAVVYGVLFFGLGKVFLPSNEAWATLLLWASALLGGYMANLLYLPRIVGMLVAGMVLINIPWSAIDSFPSKWGVQMRAAALATIFLRCGLELSFSALKAFKYPSGKLAVIPGLLEAVFDAGLGVAFFGMSYTLGLTMGFILKAVGPGLIVPQMFRLQQLGYGTDQNIPIIIVIAASFDDIVAITGYAIFSTVAIQPDAASSESVNTAWNIASGPVQIILGIIAGVLGGYVVSVTKMWNTQLKRLLIILFLGLFLMFFFEYWELLSGGAIGALFTSLVGTNLWESGSPKWASTGPSFVYGPECEHWMHSIWVWVMEPMLFSTVGSLLDFSQLQGGTVPKAVAIVCCGLAVRVCLTFLVMGGSRFSIKEKLYFSIGWTPKATVQAALSAAPLTLIEKYKVGADNYDEWVQWGNDILTTGLFAIIICGTCGTAAAQFFAPRLLKRGKISRGAGSNGTGKEYLKQEINKQHSMADYSVSDSERGRLSMVADDGGPSSAVRVPRAKSADHIDASMPASHVSRLIPGEDLALVKEYIDAIEQLTSAVHASDRVVSRDDIVQLSSHVLQVQTVRRCLISFLK